MTADPALLRFGPIGRPVAFTGCAEVIEAVAARLRGWTLTPWQGAETQAPVISVSTQGGKFVIASDFIADADVYDNETDIVCAFIVELIMAYGEANPDNLFLHAGCAVIGEKLILYPATGKTGKSTLTAQLAARGARIFSDDVVPVDLDTGRARALGVEPHLRLPVPRQLPAADRKWIEDHVSIANARMAYLGLPSSGAGALATLGEERAIKAFVLLDRSEGARPAIATCPRTDIMKLMIRQHFGADRPAQEILPRFKKLIESVACWRLVYSGGGEAADLLQNLPETP